MCTVFVRTPFPLGQGLQRLCWAQEVLSVCLPSSRGCTVGWARRGWGEQEGSVPGPRSCSSRLGIRCPPLPRSAEMMLPWPGGQGYPQLSWSLRAPKILTDGVGGGRTFTGEGGAGPEARAPEGIVLLLAREGEGRKEEERAGEGERRGRESPGAAPLVLGKPEQGSPGGITGRGSFGSPAAAPGGRTSHGPQDRAGTQWLDVSRCRLGCSPKFVRFI